MLCCSENSAQNTYLFCEITAAVGLRKYALKAFITSFAAFEDRPA